MEVNLLCTLTFNLFALVAVVFDSLTRLMKISSYFERARVFGYILIGIAVIILGSFIYSYFTNN
jgi:hypothetical protein